MLRNLPPMRSSLYAVSFAMILAACGGGDDGKTVNLADASTTKKDGNTNPVDGNTTTVDGPAAGLTGLGQECDQTHACPSAAMSCLSSQGAAKGFCSLECHAAATFMTDANGNPTDQNLGTTAADASTCNAQYTGGSAGVAACDVILNLNPAITSAPAKNTKYTYDAYCGVDCGGTMAAPTCPTGLTCNTMYGSCEP